MNVQPDLRPEHANMLSDVWPLAGVVLFALLAICVWVAGHWLSRGLSASLSIGLAAFVARCATATLAIWLVCNVLDRLIVLATAWWIPGISLLLAIAIEAVVALYRVERKFVTVRLGRMLTGLRIALIATLGLMLLQPVFAWAFQRTHDRFIAILVDDSESMQIIEDQRTREDLIREAFAGLPDRKVGLIDEITKDYKVRLYRFAEDTVELDVDRWSLPESDAEIPDTSTDSESDLETLHNQNDSRRSITDLARALRKVETDIPPENLAGVVLLTDGRDTASLADTSTADARSIAARLGAGGAPVSAMVVGDSKPVMDAAVVNVQAPTTVTEGDLIAVQARVRINGMQGRRFKVRLMLDDEELVHRPITAATDSFVSTIELLHKTAKDGIVDYRVELTPDDAVDDTASDANPVVEQSLFESNNSRAFTVAVSDNRSEILLIEGRPRWEFNYLRNLFAGRDASIQLQTVLLEPDRLATNNRVPAVHASASREAGEEEATLLPADENEWLKFDVIILGDVPAESLTAEHQRILSQFVNQRGGTLIVIAGQRHMPHRYANAPLAEMLPLEFDSAGEQFASPESSFRFQLTSLGRRHPVMQLDDSQELSDEVWKSIPEIYWRHAFKRVKPGATVLAYAGTGDQNAENLRQAQQRNALVATNRFGAGRVMLLNTDSTWRLRYRIGDVYHHRFWGQVMRWATADKLQAGTDFVRVGTQRLSYLPDESIIVTARLTDKQLAPINDDAARIRVFAGQNQLLTKTLDPVVGSPGMFRVDIGKLTTPGAYRIQLESPKADEIFANESDNGRSNSDDKVAGETKTTFELIETEIMIREAATESAEMVETTADREGLARITAAAGGTVVEIGSQNDLLDDFGDSDTSYIENHSMRLWDKWPLLAIMLVLITAEWLLRKKGGLV